MTSDSDLDKEAKISRTTTLDMTKVDGCEALIFYCNVPKHICAKHFYHILCKNIDWKESKAKVLLWPQIHEHYAMYVHGNTYHEITNLDILNNASLYPQNSNSGVFIIVMAACIKDQMGDDIFKAKFS